MFRLFKIQAQVTTQHVDDVASELPLKDKDSVSCPLILFVCKPVVPQFFDKLCRIAFVRDSLDLIIVILDGEIIIEQFLERNRMANIMICRADLRPLLELEVDPLTFLILLLLPQISHWVH